MPGQLTASGNLTAIKPNHNRLFGASTWLAVLSSSSQASHHQSAPQHKAPCRRLRYRPCLNGNIGAHFVRPIHKHGEQIKPGWIFRNLLVAQPHPAVMPPVRSLPPEAEKTYPGIRQRPALLEISVRWPGSRLSLEHDQQRAQRRTPRTGRHRGTELSAGAHKLKLCTVRQYTCGHRAANGISRRGDSIETWITRNGRPGEVSVKSKLIGPIAVKVQPRGLEPASDEPGIRNRSIAACRQRPGCNQQGKSTAARHHRKSTPWIHVFHYSSSVECRH